MCIQYCIPQQIKRWTQNVKMSLCFFLFSLLVFSCSTSALATVSKQFHFEWEYDINLPGLAGYIVYQNGQPLFTINDPTTLTIDFNVDLEPGQTTIFTMKAFDVDGNESALSAPYSFEVPVEVVNSNFLPEASLNLSTWSGEVPLAVDFFAEGSTDFDGTVVSYAWNFGDGTSANTSTANHTYTIAGNYTVTLTVTDNDGGEATAHTIVTVSAIDLPPNIPPKAELNLSTWSGDAPLVVEFFAEGSTDSDGTIVAYAWNFGDGTFASTSTASHTYTSPGLYPVALTVTDNDGGVSTAQTTVTVSALPANIPPTAELNLSTWSGDTPLVVEFFAEGSSDSDGSIVSYAWDFGDGASANTSTASHTYTTVGVYPVTLTVTDNDGGVAMAQSTVTASAPLSNISPTALFYPSEISGPVPLDVAFNGASSSDDDGTVVSYLWNFGDGSSATGAYVDHVYTTAGTFTAKLTVTDDNGAQATYEQIIVVEAAIIYPATLVADFSIDPQVPTNKDVVQFSGVVSTAPTGNITAYLWEFGDGKSESGVTVSHRYKVPGTYTVKLTVWDSSNASSQMSVVLTVKSVDERAQELRIFGAMDAIRQLLLKKKEE